MLGYCLAKHNSSKECNNPCEWSRKNCMHFVLDINRTCEMCQLHQTTDCVMSKMDQITGKLTVFDRSPAPRCPDFKIIIV